MFDYFICKNEILIKNTVKNMTTNKTITDYEVSFKLFTILF